MNVYDSINVTRLDSLAFHILVARPGAARDRQLRRTAIRLANRWGGQRHCDMQAAPRHRRNEHGSADLIVGILTAVILGAVAVFLWLVWSAAPSQSTEPGIELSNHYVVQWSTLPSCLTEDSLSGQPCTWNVNQGDGNGQGLSYYSNGDGVIHYVWTENPVRLSEGRWRWVPGKMRVRLAQEGLSLNVSCMWRTDGDDWSIIRCASGAKYAVNW